MFGVVKYYNMVAESTSVKMFFLLCWLCTMQMRTGDLVVMANTQIDATAPMKEVKEDGILALHCKITRFQTDEQKILITRQVKGGSSEWLSLDKKIQTEDSRVFLAVRMLTDSTVHFLTITGVQKGDEGRYICNIMRKDTLEVFLKSTVEIKVMYFPKGNPKCTPSSEQSYDVLEGSEVTLNCSSEKANPPVSIVWSRTGSEDAPTSVQTSGDKDFTYSLVTFRPRIKSDQSAMFTCTVKSKVFIRKTHTCHIGPLKVIPNPDMDWPMTTMAPPTTRYFAPKVRYNNTDECHEYCAEITRKSVSNWTIATMVAGLLALFFFIFGIILLVKYCLATEAVPQTPTDDINIHGMEYRIDGNRLYMTLERPGPSQTEAVYQGGEVVEREYIGTPIRDIEVIAIGAPGGPDQEGHISSPSEKGDTENKLKTPTPEEAECTIAVSPSELERKSSMGTPTRAESERESDRESIPGTPTGMLSVHGTPTKGESERLLNGTPTLPPRRYRSKSHYV